MKKKKFLLNGLRKIRDIIRSVTESQSKFYSAIVLACGFVLALGLCLVFRPKFEYHYDGDIVSWITVNKYPKQQEIYYYILSLVLIPSIAVIVWLGWLLWSYAVSFFTKLPSYYTLKKYALTYLPFLIILTRLSTPTFLKMLLIPLILFVSVNFVFLIYDLSMTRLKTITRAIFRKDLADRHWCVFASGICVGLFILVNYSDTPQKISACLKIIGLSVVAVWLFWVICAFILILITKRSFNKNLLMLTYSNVPLVLLSLISLLYEHGNALIIISLVCMLLVKILIVAKPSWIDRLDSLNCSKYLLEYVLIPAIIYILIYNGGYIHGAIDMFHEGERLAPLNEALRGGVPYKDVYLQHGLFHNFLRPFLAAKLFGPSLASDRLLGNILEPLGHIGFYLLALQVFRSKLSAFLLLWVFLSGVSEEFLYRKISYISGRLLFAYFSLATLVFYLNRVRKSPFFQRKYLSWLPAIAGIFSMIAVFYSLEIGLYTTVTCLLFLLVFGLSPQASGVSESLWKRILQRGKNGFRPLLVYVAGLFIVLIPVSIYMIIHGAFDDMLINSYIQTHYQGIIWGVSFPPLFPELAKIKSIESLKAFILSITFKWYMPILTYLIALTYLAYQTIRFRLWKEKSNVILLLLTIAGIVFLRTMLGRSDGAHFYGIAFAWILGMYLVESLFVSIWKELKMDFGVSVSWHSHKPISTLSHPFSVNAWRACAIIAFIWYATSICNPIDTLKQISTTLTGYGTIDRYNINPPIERAGSIEIPADQASQMKAVVSYIQSNTKPDETIFDFSNQGAYYFFADRPSATRYHQICYASIDAMQNEVINALENHKTRLVIFSNNAWMDSIDGVTNSARNHMVAQYLKEKYAESAKIGPTIIFKRK
jgi:hypothetical protein